MWDDLVCPADQGRLRGGDGWLSCVECGRGFPVLDSLPTLLPADENPQWRRSQAELLRQPYSRRLPDVEARSAAAERRAKALHDLVHSWLGGRAPVRVLQIGPGPDGEIHHLPGRVRYAIDPLAGAYAERGVLRWGQVRWVAGCGEWLPFPDAHFDLILVCDMLDRADRPEKLLSEVSRCLHPEGTVWLTAPARGGVLEGVVGWLKAQATRRAAGPPWRFSAATLRRLAGEAGLAAVWEGAEPTVALGRGGRSRGVAPLVRARRAYVLRAIGPVRPAMALPLPEVSACPVRLFPEPRSIQAASVEDGWEEPGRGGRRAAA